MVVLESWSSISSCDEPEDDHDTAANSGLIDRLVQVCLISYSVMVSSLCVCTTIGPWLASVSQRVVVSKFRSKRRLVMVGSVVPARLGLKAVGKARLFAASAFQNWSLSRAHRLRPAEARPRLRPRPVGNLSGDFHAQKKKSSHQF